MQKLWLVVAALLMSAAGGRAEAQLPTAVEVYDKYAAVVGGRDAWAKIVGRTEKGFADITYAGLQGSYERHSAVPNKSRMIIDVGVGVLDQGYDGTIGWEVLPMRAPTRMSPVQESNHADGAQGGALFLDPTRFAAIVVDGEEAFEGVALRGQNDRR